MSYDHQLIPWLSAQITIASTGDKAFFGCPTFPIRMRRIALSLSAAPGDAGVVKWDKRPTYGSDTSRGDGDIGVINTLTSHAAGVTVYKDINVALTPGQQAVVEVTDASANPTLCQAEILYEPTWDVPANFSTTLIAST